ncbi:thiosulfate sulfurtransferase [Frankia sp. AgB1.9]|uniref:rhodanese-like domain-containing protein n=1 Tax=unclassified Frankia TaxID=2632575 RepID=UPI00193165BD|nr:MULTISPECIES: rhodanese-like domain-containing protein [unclassified Frankia]MBL7491040.1 thiosulfate sulfurtransferase [Frankia sp. AgW1.1]MBL7549612.1 thiosulfate sulfurtransferase [Frankia sp. AgB1.9]MBL7620407.1 rhodanese-related sulfurtransferase [Frankia sp. AgB1.8]
MTGSAISAEDLHTLLGASSEFALLDVRDARVTSERGSILLGVAAPLGVLETRIDALVPRRSTPVVVYDSGDEGLAARAARRLAELGYSDVRPLDGGLHAWADAGYKVHTGGDHVVGQAFGEFVEDVYKTPHVTVAELLAAQAEGRDVVILDSRPLEEFRVHSLPGGTSIPGAELVYRVDEVVASPDALVVVNCAGRTRSIIGAQTLINAGLPNRVVALEGGTQSWILEGHTLDHGKVSAAPPPRPANVDVARTRARHVAERFGIPTIDGPTLRRFQSEGEERSVYLLDVRPREEFEAGHLPGSLPAPSWDLAPWVFRHVGTHNARIVLVDGPDLVRATVAASWVTQIGWGEVFVTSTDSGEELETGPVAPVVLGLGEVDLVDAGSLRDALGSATAPLVVDLAPSTGYLAGHLPGAVFAPRARLADAAAALSGDGAVVLTSPDGVVARLAAPELAAVTDRPVTVLAGGTAAWAAAGFPVEAGDGHFVAPAEDAIRHGWFESDPERQKEGFRRYLAWEIGLVAELREDDTVPFRTFL